MEEYLSIEKVAVTCGVSVQTINNWYKFKRENPDDQRAKLLPDYIVVGGHGQRFWKQSEVDSIIEFKRQMPSGCKGIMGSVTQRYVKPTNSESKRAKKDLENKKQECEKKEPEVKRIEKGIVEPDFTRPIPTIGTIVKYFLYDIESNNKKYLYVIIGDGINIETNEQVIVFRELYGNKRLCTCSLGEFTSKVDFNKYPNSQQTYKYVRYDTK